MGAAWTPSFTGNMIFQIEEQQLVTNKDDKAFFDILGKALFNSDVPTVQLFLYTDQRRMDYCPTHQISPHSTY